MKLKRKNSLFDRQKALNPNAPPHIKMSEYI